MPTEHVPRTVDDYPKFASNLIDHEKNNSENPISQHPEEDVAFNQSMTGFPIPAMHENNVAVELASILISGRRQALPLQYGVCFLAKSDRNDASTLRPTPLAWDINSGISYSTKRNTPSVCVIENSIKINNTNNIIIDFKQAGTQNKAKPKGYSGAVIILAITDKEPETNDGYTGHILATKTPHTIEFDTHDSGKRVWVRACWQNARGILGSWSEAKTAIIP
ncbi:MAG: hypothetical protein FWG98_09725 [Candidatus Cloacimonetes bacterium]|nr:hypothetical protein [Candidatus Cloacimonadota bacterium]